MYDIEATDMSFTVDDSSRTTHVTTTGDHDEVTSVELDEASDLKNRLSKHIRLWV
jgi:riboflavin synthase alpha subunit